MKLYRIKNWSEIYENNRTRDLKHMAWVPIPNDLDGDGYTLMVDRPNGAAIFGAWIACVEVASKCDPRGTFLRQGAVPHNSASLSRITRIPRDTIEEMLRVAEIECKWLESNEAHEGAGIPQESAATPHLSAKNRTEQNGTEQNNITSAPTVLCEIHKPFTAHAAAEDIYGTYPKKVGKPVAIRAIQKQLRTICPDCLLARVRTYAEARKACDPQFTPHPATWFNQQRYNDDPKTWMVAAGDNGNGQHPTQPTNGADKYIMQKELDRIDVRLKAIRGEASEDAWGPHYSDEAKAEIRKLKARKAELQTGLGVVA